MMGGNCNIRLVRSSGDTDIAGGRYKLQSIKQRPGKCMGTAKSCSWEHVNLYAVLRNDSHSTTGFLCIQTFEMVGRDTV
jgi:hypothetical protein